MILTISGSGMGLGGVLDLAGAVRLDAVDPAGLGWGVLGAFLVVEKTNP